MSEQKGKYRDRFTSSWNSYDIRDEWVPIVDKALDEIFEKYPDTLIVQIKEKFGDLRLYLDSYNDEVRATISAAEMRCYEQSQDLTY